MAQTAVEKKELCIRCLKKPPSIKGELWCYFCFKKVFNPIPKKQFIIKK